MHCSSLQQKFYIMYLSFSKLEIRNEWNDQFYSIVYSGYYNFYTVGFSVEKIVKISRNSNWIRWVREKVTIFFNNYVEILNFHDIFILLIIDQRYKIIRFKH